DDALAAVQREVPGTVHAERLVHGARHVEVQVLGDGTALVALGDRDCSLQRRRQKLVELAPAPGLPETLRARLATDAVRLLPGYRGLGTVEFLVRGEEHWFLEVNPRLQVEHTVTEQVLGVDLVAAHLRVALGATLAELGLASCPPGRGAAVQLRVLAEQVRPDGTPVPTTGTLRSLDLPAGPGVRVDTAASTGWSPDPRFDSLVAKVVVWAPSAEGLLERARRVLGELRTPGLPTNAGLLDALLQHPEVRAGATTETVDALLPQLAAPAPDVDALSSPVAGTVVGVAVQPGEQVRRGQVLVVVEAMKMEHAVTAPSSGSVASVAVTVGQTVAQGLPLVQLSGRADDLETAAESRVDLDDVRPDLAEVHRRLGLLEDAARPVPVAKVHARGRRTARENVADLVDPGSFTEYGGLLVAAQRSRRPEAELVEQTPADGIVTGTATVEGRPVAVLSYDYTVLAGTQGFAGHAKTDRFLGVVERQQLPTVWFTEGGGGRPGDTDVPVASALDCRTFAAWGRLSGLVPRIAVVSGRCFAGNAALAGSADLVVATPDTTLGMGGPAMIEGGGLGVFRPEEVGPLAVHLPAGSVDVAVADDAEAVAVARRLLGDLAGTPRPWESPDQRRLRAVVPEDRKRAYDVRDAVALLADTGSVSELRTTFAPGMVTALARLEGRPVGVLANNPLHLGGAIDSDGADKAARFLQLCEAFDLPVLSLVDTPGMMVGPDVERTGLVRHCSRLFVVGANLTVPFVAVVLRKAYGLGAQAMMAGSTHEPLLTLAWPGGEMGAMGLEGAVRLGFRRELEAADDPAALYASLVAMAYERSKVLTVATYGDIDAVVDPADTRRLVVQALAAAPTTSRTGKKVPWVDTW
ncbi:MAG: carbamoyl-phosphate synthase large subunit, partial [Frankiales bacterium]|nr:carbamoyl-phosphate synthase large subunit [Frankiales bacterium]